MLRGIVLLCALAAISAARGPGSRAARASVDERPAAVLGGSAEIPEWAVPSERTDEARPLSFFEARPLPFFEARPLPFFEARPLPFFEARPLPFFYDLYTFRGDAGRTTVVASFAVPAGELRREGGLSFARYRFDVTFILADTVRRSVFRSDDSVYVSRPWPLDGDHLLHTHVEVQASPSRTTIHRVVMTDATRPGVGQLYRAPFPIPDYSGSTLMLSDIALGLPGATSGWMRGDVVLALLPTSQFPESEFDVYYEIYNLPPGTPYTTEVSVEPVDEAGAPLDEAERVRTFFAGESAPGPAGYVPELRRVESALPEGHYRLTVTVRDELTERTATRERLFRVEPWEAGATMVRALPRRTATGS